MQETFDADFSSNYAENILIEASKYEIQFNNLTSRLKNETIVYMLKFSSNSCERRDIRVQ